MQENSFTLAREDGVALLGYRWTPDSSVQIRGVFQILHGMAEHCGRYRPLAQAATARGYVVWAHDHRGHGRTAGTIENRGFFAEKNGFEKVVDDAWAVSDLAAKEHPELPRVLFGHSMGSFFLQRMMMERGRELAGVALCASASPGSNPLAPIGQVLARAERARVGARAPSALLTRMSFGEFNRAFSPARTPFDWLSRDTASVDQYIADPWCGFDVSTQLWIDVLDALAQNAKPQNFARIPSSLPIYLVAGEDDPVNNKVRYLRQLATEYYKYTKTTELTWKIYPGARHELLNETIRDQFIEDLLVWTDHVCSKKKQ